MIRLVLLMTWTVFTLSICTTSHAQMTCTNLLETSIPLDERLYDLIELTRKNFFNTPNEKNLKYHIQTVEFYLSHSGVEYTVHNNVIIISRVDEPGTLNSFADKVGRILGADTLYDPQTLQKKSAQGMMYYIARENGKLIPDSLLLSFEAIAGGQPRSVEAHELAHGLELRFGANKPGFQEGSIFSAGLTSRTDYLPVDEARTYFTTFSTLVSSFRSERRDQEDFQEHFNANSTSLKSYVDANQNALDSIKLNPIKRQLDFQQLGEMYYANQDQSLVVLLSPREDGSNVVTVKIETAYGLYSLILKKPLKLDIELESLTSPQNFEKLNSLFIQLDTQLNETSRMLTQVQNLLSSFPEHKVLSEDDAVDFIQRYRSIILPHLRARLDSIP